MDENEVLLCVFNLDEETLIEEEYRNFDL